MHRWALIRLARFPDMPIKAKFTMLIALSAAFAVVVASGVLLVGGVAQLRAGMVGRVSGLAEVIGANVSAAIASDDREAAEKALASLSREPMIAHASVYDAGGRVLARYGAPVEGLWEPAHDVGVRFHDRRLDVAAPIVEGGAPVGVVILSAHTDELRALVVRAVLAAMAAVGGAVGLALIAASRLQRVVCDPILGLAAAAARVARSGDYSVRVEKPGNDEVGLLCDGFNEMLRQIQTRDRALELLAAIEQSSDMIVITGPEGTIEYVNPSFERVTGYSRAEAIGRNPRILKSGKHDGRFYEDLWARLKRGESWNGRFTNKRKDGTLYEEEAAISPVRSAKGEIVKYVATKRDVTLERRVEEQLRQSQKMEAVGQLAGGIAHDLNNVLTVINGHAELMLERAKSQDSPMRRSASEILKSGTRAAALVRQILAFGRRQVLQPRIVDLNSVVEGMKGMLECLLTERVAMALDLASDAGFVEADPNQVEQIVMNLAVNARDAMPEGGKLTLRTWNVGPGDACGCRPDGASGPCVALSVTDTGVGMTEDVKAHIFEPFFSTKGRAEGTGLGLATVYGIVKQSGGEIEVRTEPGAGTTFTVVFPCAGDRRARTTLETAVSCRARGAETVLVVDDDESIRTFLGTVLRDLGYKVLEARDGLEALEAAGEHPGPVHLAIADLSTPALGGSELASQLARVRPGAQMLYISGYSGGDGDGCPLEGHHVLPRPFDAEALARKVREVLIRGAGSAA